ncbi:ester cyclase [Nonomuraea angiospora]|uniref:Steroid delta-isomerase-like uncharacterized protein n=1 Tax=Nonomuraea angiospora TaxID=46172 RepID=A0ABR9M9M4_9ACTN|nr:ester cyclase [Nonomuraea angiospora]MBE1589320.1 steroid delta-isomerase-like uncharacterized protein [Nonomuraea angiospora]
MGADATETNMALMRRAYEMLESHDLERCAELLTENFVAHVPGVAGPLHGREIWARGAETMRDAFPDMRIDVQHMFGADDKVAVIVHFKGTHQGSFNGVEATRRPVSFRSVEIYRIEAGKIAEEWVAPDIMGLMAQIRPAEADRAGPGQWGDSLQR